MTATVTTPVGEPSSLHAWLKPPGYVAWLTRRLAERTTVTVQHIEDTGPVTRVTVEAATEEQAVAAAMDAVGVDDYNSVSTLPGGGWEVIFERAYLT